LEARDLFGKIEINISMQDRFRIDDFLKLGGSAISNIEQGTSIFTITFKTEKEAIEKLGRLLALLQS
jgi:hypothetical protein